MPCVTIYLAGDDKAESLMQVQGRVRDFDDALNEIRDTPNIKLYSQATPNRHGKKHVINKMKDSTTSTSPRNCNNSSPQRKPGGVKAQWGFFKKTGRAFKCVGRKIWRGIKRAGKKIWKGAKRLGQKVWRGLRKLGKKAWRGVKKVGKKIWRGVKKVAKKAWKGIKKAGKWVWTGIKKVGKVALKFAKSPIGRTLITGGLTKLGIPPRVSGPLVGAATGLADIFRGGNRGPPSGYGQQPPNFGPPSGYDQPSPGYSQHSSDYGTSSTNY